jgi:phospholipase C
LDPNITRWRRAVVGDLILEFDSEPPTDSTVLLPSSAEHVETGKDGVADPAIGAGIAGARDVVAGSV